MEKTKVFKFCLGCQTLFFSTQTIKKISGEEGEKFLRTHKTEKKIKQLTTKLNFFCTSKKSMLSHT